MCLATPGTSDANVLRLFQTINADRSVLDAPLSRRVRRKVYHDLYEEIGDTIRLRLLTPHCSWDWEIASAPKLLAVMLRESPGLAAVYADALAKHPCAPETPWHAVLYCDELTPSNALAPDNKRKSMMVHMTFRELDAWDREDAWLTLACARTCVVKDVAGGWSCVLRVPMERLVQTISPSSGGVALPLATGPQLLWATIDKFIADMDAIQKSYGWRGASSILPCPRCKNVMSRPSNLAGLAPGLVAVGSTDVAAFDERDDDDYRRTVELLESARDRVIVGAMAKSSFEELQKAIGWTHNALGLLQDAPLRRHFSPANALVLGPMHC